MSGGGKGAYLIFPLCHKRCVSSLGNLGHLVHVGAEHLDLKQDTIRRVSDAIAESVTSSVPTDGMENTAVQYPGRPRNGSHTDGPRIVVFYHEVVRWSGCGGCENLARKIFIVADNAKLA